MYINVINLETDKSKLYNIVTNFKELNIKYKIFKGIDGLTYTLTSEDKKNLENVDYDILIKKGVVGCHLSHIKLLENFLNSSSAEYIIVCEDDIQIIEKDVNKIINILKHLTLDIIYLGGLQNPSYSAKRIVKINEKYSLYDCKNRYYAQGAIFYMMSRKGVLNILHKYHNGLCKYAIDRFYVTEFANQMILYPSLCTHDGTNSSIDKRGGH